VEIPEEEVERQLDVTIKSIMAHIRRFVTSYFGASITRMMQLYDFTPVTQHRIEPFYEPGRVGLRMVLEVYLDEEQIEDLRRKIARRLCEKRLETLRKARAAEMVKKILRGGDSRVRGAEAPGPGESGEGAGGGGAEDGSPQGGHSAESANQGAEGRAGRA
jgi:hypothetical protein